MKPFNRRAIEYIEDYAKNRTSQAKASLKEVCSMSNISDQELSALMDQIRNKARIGLHFHPFRLDENSQSVIESLIQSGQYKNQFETKISNGALSPFPGGKRDAWENTLFGQAYASHPVELSRRPKYGALSLLSHSDGPSPRFGSCYFLLKPALNKYATFTYLDSHTNPAVKGTINYFDEVVASMLSDSFESDFALGEGALRPHQLVQRITHNLLLDLSEIIARSPQRNLNHYIEAQIHTVIDLKRDVDFLVADRCFKNTRYEALFQELCQKYEIALLWNQGFELPASKVPDHFRGKQMPVIASALAKNGIVNAYWIGEAEKKYCQEISDEVVLAKQLQLLKYLWHTLVKYGDVIERTVK